MNMQVRSVIHDVASLPDGCDGPAHPARDDRHSNPSGSPGTTRTSMAVTSVEPVVARIRATQLGLEEPQLGRPGRVATRPPPGCPGAAIGAARGRPAAARRCRPSRRTTTAVVPSRRRPSPARAGRALSLSGRGSGARRRGAVARASGSHVGAALGRSGRQPGRTVPWSTCSTRSGTACSGQRPGGGQQRLGRPQGGRAGPRLRSGSSSENTSSSSSTGGLPASRPTTSWAARRRASASDRCSPWEAWVRAGRPPMASSRSSRCGPTRLTPRRRSSGRAVDQRRGRGPDPARPSGRSR